MRNLLSSFFIFCLLAIVCVTLSAGAQTTAPNEWTWMGGSNQTPTHLYFNGYGWSGVYGTMGTPAAGNIPGSRAEGADWIDPSGNLWLYGGYGFDSAGTLGYLNDLWEFNPATDEWTWIGGSNTIPACGAASCSVPPVIGTMGTPAAGNTPGGLMGPSNWVDNGGHFWLFGGMYVSGGQYAGGGSFSEVGLPNGLWEYFPDTNEWALIMAWPHSSECLEFLCGGVPGTYGTLQTPAAGNEPGGRNETSNWVDNGGHFWLFGGGGTDANGYLGELNDLWEFSPSTNEWAWMSGSSTIDSNYTRPGVYGTLGQPSSGNTPGARDLASSWTDKSGDLWLFGGQGSDTSDKSGDLNDLWKFDTSTNEWTWMGGSSTFVPLDCATYSGAYECQYGEPGVYGTLGTPAAANTPGGRFGASTWMDSNGNPWLFGGGGFDASGNNNNLNDLWEFNSVTHQWTWVGGSNEGGPSAVYGTLGTPAAANIPAGRVGAATWTDKNGNLWLFGGQVGLNYLNDVWEYQPSFPAVATPTLSLVAGTYSSVQTLTISDATAGAEIYYTLDGTEPTASSTLYSSSITVGSTETVQALATSSGYFNSPVASAAYVLNVPPDFSVSASPASMTLTAGSSGTATLSITPQGGFVSAVSFACSGLPSGATCSFSPSSVTPTSPAAATTTLTVTTTATSAMLRGNRRPLFPEAALAIAVCLFGFRKRKSLQLLLLLGVSLTGFGLLSGCGGGSSSSGPQPVTSTVTVTATSGSLVHTTTFSLIVN